MIGPVTALFLALCALLAFAGAWRVISRITKKRALHRVAMNRLAAPSAIEAQHLANERRAYVDRKAIEEPSTALASIERKRRERAELYSTIDLPPRRAGP